MTAASYNELSATLYAQGKYDARKKPSLRLPPQERIGQAIGTVVRRAEGPRPFAHPYYWAAFILIGATGPFSSSPGTP